MVLALLTASLVSIIGLIATLYLGFAIEGRTGLADHFHFALFTTFLVVLAQSMTMFYFIGTGRQVKDLVVHHPMAADFIERTRRFKSRVFPPALYAMLFTMAAWIIGGGVDTHVIPVVVHTILSALALIFNVQAFIREARYMAEHNMLMEELDRLLVEAPPGGRSIGQLGGDT